MTEISIRKIASLALPALVVLAAEPIYLLVDTAVVGHLGDLSLASLGAGGAILSFAAWLGNVLAYGTTSRSARLFGFGQRAEGVAEGVQASWLALAAGVLLAVAMQLFALPLVELLTGYSRSAFFFRQIVDLCPETQAGPGVSASGSLFLGPNSPKILPE